MKAEMDSNGVIKISAETEIETYALRCWCNDERNGDRLGIPSLLLIDASPPKDRDKEGES